MSDWDAGVPSPASFAAAAPGAAANTAISLVRDAVGATADLDALPPAEHVARFDAVHRALADALSAIDGA